MIRQAVLLVGGRGTRMWPLTADQPKGLLPVAGTPFIELQFRLLAEVGVQQVFLAVGREHEAAWRDYAAAVTEPVVVVSVEETPLDTAGPVAALCPQLSLTTGSWSSTAMSYSKESWSVSFPRQPTCPRCFPWSRWSIPARTV